MRVFTWNMRRARAASYAWELFRNSDPDIALLQEVGGVPDDVRDQFHISHSTAVRKDGSRQRFGNAIISKWPQIDEVKLVSELGWVNAIGRGFGGNILVRRIRIADREPINVISFYSPAWPVPVTQTETFDISAVKLLQNPQLWLTEILWKLLLDTGGTHESRWIVGGDFNSSETFDYLWGPKPRGNLEIIERMNGLGLRDALREVRGGLVPTFRNPRGGKVVHQIDHLYLSPPLLGSLEDCFVGDGEAVFGRGLSDHLPITAEINL